MIPLLKKEKIKKESKDSGIRNAEVNRTCSQINEYLMSIWNKKTQEKWWNSRRILSSFFISFWHL